MHSSLLATLSSKGQLTLPKSVRDSLHLKTGEHVLLEMMPDGVYLKKAAIEAVETPFGEGEWSELARLAKPKGRVYKNSKAFLKSLK